MSISAVSSAGPVATVAPSERAVRASASPVPDAGATTSGVSTGARYLSQLSSMAPADRTQLLTKLASDLRAEAGQVGGPRASHLTVIADKLTKAADSGDLSSLFPTGGRARGAQAAYAATGSSW